MNFENTILNDFKIGSTQINKILKGSDLIWEKVLAKTLNLEQTITNPTALGYETFGNAIALYGDTLVVGTEYAIHPTLAHASGEISIYVNVAGTWTLQQTISNPNSTTNDYFGNAVAIYGDTLVVGAYLDDQVASNAGVAYIYTRTAGVWTLQRQLNDPIPINTSDKFGSSVSIYGDTVITGAPQKDTGATDAGSVHIWIRTGTTWTIEQTINNPNAANNDRFGHSVSLFGNTLVIGAIYDITDTISSGSVYVYTRSGSTWTLEATITNPTPFLNDSFGNSVSIYEDSLVVGAHLDNTIATDSGSVYVYTRSGTSWTLEQEINNPNPIANDQFGYSVSLYADNLIIGAPYDDALNGDAGSAYVYTRSGTTWTLQSEITNPSPVTGDWFGWSVCSSVDTFMVGAPGDDGTLLNVGSVYVYK